MTARSATQFAAHIVGIVPYDPPVTRRGPRYARSHSCWLCGGATDGIGWPRDTALPVTFASHNAAAVQSSDAICQACAAFAGGDTWQRYVAERAPAIKNWGQASWRSYGHFFAAPDRHECPTRKRWRDILLDPPQPPFLAIVSLSGQKNLIFRGAVAYSRDMFPVQVEEERIYLDRARFRACLDDVEAALAAGLSREGIRTGRHNSAKALTIGLAVFERMERALAAWRREVALLDLVLYCAQRPASDDEQPERKETSCAMDSTPTTSPQQLALF